MGELSSWDGSLCAEPIVTTGGLSPNGKLAVVVTRDEDTSQDSVSTDNEHPALKDVISGKVIGPLEEVDTFGGGFGHVLANLTTHWSPKNDFFAITYRAGRLDYDTIIYRIRPYHSSWRAIPQTLPADSTGPNGKAIFAHLFHRANEGTVFESWLGPSKVALTEYGRMPTSDTPNGYFGDGSIGIVYSNDGANWTVQDYRLPPGDPVEAGRIGSSDGRVTAVLEYPGASRDFYALTVRDYQGSLLFRNDKMTYDTLEGVKQTKNGQFIIVMMSGRNDGITAWAYSVKDKSLRVLGDFGRPTMFPSGADSMRFYNLNPTNISNPDAPENWVTIDMTKDLKKME